MGTAPAFESAEKEIRSNVKLKNYEEVQLIIISDFLCILSFTIYLELNLKTFLTYKIPKIWTQLNNQKPFRIRYKFDLGKFELTISYHL
jgi:hypothetical protein